MAATTSTGFPPSPTDTTLAASPLNSSSRLRRKLLMSKVAARQPVKLSSSPTINDPTPPPSQIPTGGIHTAEQTDNANSDSTPPTTSPNTVTNTTTISHLPVVPVPHVPVVPVAARPRQAAQMDFAIWEYLEKYYPPLAEPFKTEAKITSFRAQGQDILVTKWAATMRMTLKISELEKELIVLREKLALHEEVSKFRSHNDGIPMEPASKNILGHRKPINAVIFHPVFLLIVTASEDTTIKVWEFETGSLERTLVGHTESVNDLSLDKTGRWLASASSDASIKIWDFTKMDSIKSLYGHENSVTSVEYLGTQSKVLLSASIDKTVKVWDSSTGDCLKTFTGHGDRVKSVAACPQINGLFASASSDFTVKVWVFVNQFSTPSSNKTIRRRNSLMPESNSNPLVELLGHSHVVENVTFATSALLKVLAKNGKAPMSPLKLNSSDTDDAALDTLRQGVHGDSEYHQHRRPSFFSSLLSSSASQPNCDINDNEAVLKLSGPVVISSSRDTTIQMWDAIRGVCITKFEGHTNWVKQVVCHPTGQYILSCSDDRTIRVWNVIDGSVVTCLSSAHPAFITCIAIQPQCCIVGTGSLDNTLKIWLPGDRNQIDNSTVSISDTRQNDITADTANRTPANVKTDLSNSTNTGGISTGGISTGGTNTDGISTGGINSGGITIVDKIPSRGSTKNLDKAVEHQSGESIEQHATTDEELVPIFIKRSPSIPQTTSVSLNLNTNDTAITGTNTGGTNTDAPNTTHLSASQSASNIPTHPTRTSITHTSPTVPTAQSLSLQRPKSVANRRRSVSVQDAAGSRQNSSHSTGTSPNTGGTNTGSTGTSENTATQRNGVSPQGSDAKDSRISTRMSKTPHIQTSPTAKRLASKSSSRTPTPTPKETPIEDTTTGGTNTGGTHTGGTHTGGTHAGNKSPH